MGKKQQNIATPRLLRSVYLMAAFGNIAVSAYLLIMLADLDKGRIVLGAISALTSAYFAFKTVE